MTADEIRTKYLEYLKAKGHTVVPSASLVPENDPTTLFTGSGMQPMVPYLLGRAHPAGSRIVDSQKCFRSGDIEEVGNNRHTTFFEMLGNWSLGDYYKEEQLEWLYEFLTAELGLPKEKLWVTCFAGDEALGLKKDTEAADIWKRLGMSEDHILFYDATKNWWSRAGEPRNMPIGEPGGGDSEVFYDFGEALGFHEQSEWKNEPCHPNCDCGRFVEIGNSVFMQYIKKEDGSFGLLPKKNIDFGGGLERIAMAVNDLPDIFLTNHQYIIGDIERFTGTRYAEHEKEYRIIADHIKATVFLIADGVAPSNKDQGYFVRRLLRRSMLFLQKLQPGFPTASLVRSIADSYRSQYPEIEAARSEIERTISEEESQFVATLARGMREFEKLASAPISGADAFTLFSTYGFPFELTQELAAGRGIAVDEKAFREEMEKHQDLSRAGSEQKFKGGLADASEATTRLHTAHHLLLKALQHVLGPHVKQRGSNITGERLRIDFSHGEKMTDEQKKEVERIVNEKIDEDLPVIRTTMPKEEAEQLGAEHEFGAKYPEMVSVYSVGPKEATPEHPQHEKAFSIEFCGGPHAERTGVLGHFTLKKEEASSAGVRRIKGVLNG